MSSPPMPMGSSSAVKLYPAGATTNSASGVRDFDKVRGVLEAMAEAGICRCAFHGEVTDPAVDIFDREAVFIDRVLDPVRRATPGLRVVMEHITTSDGVAYVSAGATISARPSPPITWSSTATISSWAASGRITTACRSPSAKSIAWLCARPRPRGVRASSLAPTVRPIPTAPRNGLRLRRLLHRDQHHVDPRAGLRGRRRA
jgi:hypothetical protein